MTGGTGADAGIGADAEQLWAAYLDAVEASADAIARQAVDRSASGTRDLAPPPLPSAPWPPSLEGRRREVMAALVRATSTVERCRDQAAVALHALGRPAPRGSHDYLEGGALDVLG